MRAIYACDVGSTRSKVPKFAWARILPERSSELVGSSDIRELVSFLAHDLKNDRSVALEFETPLFMPVPDQAEDLSRGRSGEGGRSMFAPAGAAVATLGLHQAAWILRGLFLSCGEECAFTLDWAEWPPECSRPLLFCWEAFVSQGAHSASLTGADLEDAATAAKEFLISEDDLSAANSTSQRRVAVPEIDPKELRRLRSLESRLDKANEKAKKQADERRELQRRLRAAERLAERTERAEASAREANQSLEAERREHAEKIRAADERVRAAEENAEQLLVQVNGLVEVNRKQAERIEEVSPELESLRRAGEEARQAAEAAREEARNAREARDRMAEVSRSLEEERDRLRARAETAEAQLKEEGRPPVLSRAEAVRIVVDLVENLRGSLTDLSVRDGELNLKYAYQGEGEPAGIVIPTVDSGPEIREILNELTLHFE